MKYGYVQVSTREQNEQWQMLALKEYRIEKNANIHGHKTESGSYRNPDC